MAELETSFARKAEMMVIGHIRGQCRGPKRLNVYVSSRLHQSFVSLLTRQNNYFEVQFHQEAGQTQTLTDRTYTFDNQNILFIPWSPFFNIEVEGN